MKRAAFALLAAFAMPAAAAPGGPIDTMQLGNYHCELPGDATGPAGIHQPQEDFAVVNSSSYEASGQRGAYLMTGDTMVMTSGPKRGERFRRQTDGFLRKLDADGTDSDLRCIRRTRNNS